MKNRSADEPTNPEGREAPESANPDEAVLLSAWAEMLESDDDVPDEILGLLDGTLRGDDAARARVRLASDPALTKAAGDLVASWRELDPSADVPALPGPLMSEVLDLVPPVPAEPGRWQRWTAWARAAAAPGLAAAAAGALLVTFVVLERTPRAPADATLRAGAATPSVVRLEAPAPGEHVTGAVEFRWQRIGGAVRYRLVLVDAVGGEVAGAGHTSEARLLVPPDYLAQRFGESDSLSFHWIVRARLLDGSEVSSEPRRATWSAR